MWIIRTTSANKSRSYQRFSPITAACNTEVAEIRGKGAQKVSHFLLPAALGCPGTSQSRSRAAGAPDLSSPPCTRNRGAAEQWAGEARWLRGAGVSGILLALETWPGAKIVVLTVNQLFTCMGG